MATLLLDRGADLTVCMSNTGAFPVHIATEQNRVETLELLLRRGADPDVRRQDGTTALYTAIDKSNNSARPKLLDLLLAAKAKPDIPKTSPGTTPLHRAVQKGDEASVTRLIQGGADAGKGDCDGQTPLVAAVFGGRTAMVKAFVDAKAELDGVDVDGASPLYVRPAAFFWGVASEPSARRRDPPPTW